MKEDIETIKAKRNPINSLVDLKKHIIGRKNGIFYFTERFRIDFKKMMCEFEELKENSISKNELKQIIEKIIRCNDIDRETLLELIELVGGEL